MVAEAVQRKLGESDDLDWKEDLPATSPVKGEWNEFAKDVAAMANTRGGLLVYGVSDDISMVGIDLDGVNDKQLGQWLRVHLQPTVSGVSYLKLPATDGTDKDILVVDVPASEMAPHFLYGWQQKDKDKTTFNAPFRYRDDTGYMAEHQVALAYRERFARQAVAEAALDQHVQHVTVARSGRRTRCPGGGRCSPGRAGGPDSPVEAAGSSAGRLETDREGPQVWREDAR
ncbi:AlbA family DNA-binding domain-containing protein [Streptomyces mirabilis]|uniref:AlbA family DNA-binding domain-containing protein n=1 Tax=Streptomyces mirabilis TaxID=68239 RepID=UPI00365697BB